MASPSQLADFARRSRGNPAPSTPVKKLPKLAETLAVFARTEERKKALQDHDEATEKWRQSLSFGGGATLTAASAPTIVTPAPVTIPSTVPALPPVPGPRGLAGPTGISGVDVPPAMLCEDNGKVYRYTPRPSDEGSTTGEWVETSDAPTWQFVPRVGDSGDITGQWQAAGVFSQDDGKRYRFVPRLGDGGTIVGQWVEA